MKKKSTHNKAIGAHLLQKEPNLTGSNPSNNPLGPSASTGSGGAGTNSNISPRAQIVAGLLSDSIQSDAIFARYPELVTAKSLSSLAARLVGVEASTSAVLNTVLHYSRHHMLQEMREGKFLTNDLVGIRSDLDRTGSSELNVNTAAIEIERCEFVLAYVLTCDAFKYWRETLIGPRHPHFMSVQQICSAIEELRGSNSKLGDVWVTPAPSRVHQVICDLRKKLAKAGANPQLIEKRMASGGYRISTRPANIMIELPHHGKSGAHG